MSSSVPVLGVVIGTPVSHSLSPVIYQEAFRTRGVLGDYEVIECDVSQLESTLQHLWNSDVQAISVTMPLKDAVVPFMSQLDANARSLNAVNCVSRGENGWVGHNTDGDGCCDAIEEEGGISLLGCTAVVMGAGGTARSVCMSLVGRGTHVVVVNRSIDRAEELVAKVAPFLSNGASIEIGDQSVIDRADVLINTTSVGMNSTDSPVIAEHLHAGLVVLDAVYQPMNTQLLTDARAVGAQTIDGLSMLIQQARRQCVHQFGWKPEAKPLRDAAERELASRRK